MLRVGVWSVAVAVGLCLAIPAGCFAQGAYKVTKYNVRYLYVSGYTDRDERDFDSRADAKDAAEKYKAANNKPGVSLPGSYVASYEIFPVQITITPSKDSTWQDRLAKAKEAVDTLREAKEAVDKAREFVKKGFTASERKLGDTLKEYQDRIKKTYEEMGKLKTNMKSMTGSITQKQFDEVNKLINSYNSYQGAQDQYKGGNLGTKMASMPPISRIQPSDLKVKILPATTAKLDPPLVKPPPPVKSAIRVEKPISLAGSSFAGSETLGGYGNLRFSFAANGSATMYDKDGSTSGIWSKNGNQVTLRFYGGNVIYRGTLSGRTLSGTATNGKTNWSWTLKSPAKIDPPRNKDTGGLYFDDNAPKGEKATRQDSDAFIGLWMPAEGNGNYGFYIKKDGVAYELNFNALAQAKGDLDAYVKKMRDPCKWTSKDNNQIEIGSKWTKYTGRISGQNLTGRRIFYNSKGEVTNDYNQILVKKMK